MTEPNPLPGVLEEGDEAVSVAARQSLTSRPKRRHLRSSDHSHSSTRVRDFITEAVLGPQNKDDREVDDSFFQVVPERTRISVKVQQAAGSIRKKIGGGGGGGSRKGSNSDVDLAAKATGTATTAGGLGRVQEEEDHHEPTGGTAALAASSSSQRRPAQARFSSSSQSFFDSPNTSLESIGTYPIPSRTATSTTDDSRPPTPSATAAPFPPLSPSTSSYQPRHPSRASILTTTTDDDLLLTHAPSRTLTIDEATLKPSSSGRRKRSHHHRPPTSSRAADLARRAHRAFMGDASMTEMGDKLEDQLAHAGFLGDDKEQYEVDILWENQRGLVVFGLPKFAANALVAVDPAPWTDHRLRNSAFTTQNHPLPTPAWKWDHDQWMVDMGLDTDESGWQYAWRFRSSHWRGEAEGWRSFVRRRRWIRGRYYLPPPLLLPKSPGTATDDSGGMIDWAALLANSEFADAATPLDGPAVSSSPDLNSSLEPSSRPPSRLSSTSLSRSAVTGLKTATSLLPIPDETKSDVFGWDVALDAHDPFLPWSFVSAQGDVVLARRRAHYPNPASRSDSDLVGLWREAVVEINYHRVARVLRQCRVDREKLGLWRWWLGEEASPRPGRVPELFDEVGRDPDTCGTITMKVGDVVRDLAVNGRAEVGLDARSWDEDGVRPAAEDVWDLIEARLDHILQLFEFQHSRLHLLRLVLSLHPVTHGHHHYQGFDGDSPFEPEVLSPALLGSRLGRRMDFYADVKELTAFFEGHVERDAKGKAKETSVA